MRISDWSSDVCSSDLLVNFQIGLEDPDKLSQQTLLLTYASDRVTSRGLQAGTLQQPPIVERPGLRLDAVIRQGFSAFGAQGELTLAVRNITGTGYRSEEHTSELQSLMRISYAV